jgi:hypothetical protein
MEFICLIVIYLEDEDLYDETCLVVNNKNNCDEGNHATFLSP